MPAIPPTTPVTHGKATWGLPFSSWPRLAIEEIEKHDDSPRRPLSAEANPGSDISTVDVEAVDSLIVKYLAQGFRVSRDFRAIMILLPVLTKK